MQSRQGVMNRGSLAGERNVLEFDEAVSRESPQKAAKTYEGKLRPALSEVLTVSERGKGNNGTPGSAAQ